MQKTNRDLTQGNIVGQVLLVALPLVCAQALQNLYSTVDSLIVGNYVGKTALAAVTSCSDISRLIVGFFVGLSAGSGVLFSTCFGAKDYDKLHRAIHTALPVAGLIGLLLAGSGILITPLLLKFVNCPPDVYNEASAYLRVYLVGVFLLSIYNVGAGVLRAVGDTKSPLLFLIAACACNITLDLILVKRCRLGVTGAALATIASQLLSVTLLLRKMLCTKDVYRFVLKDVRIEKKLLQEVLRLGLPAAAQSALVHLSNLFIQRYVNSFASSAMAGIGVAKRIDGYASNITQSLGLSTAIFVGQNVGAKKYDRIIRGIRHMQVASIIGVVVLAVPAWIYAAQLIRLFTDDAQAIRVGSMMVRTIIPFYSVHSVYQIMSNTIRGFGRAQMGMVCSIGGMILCRQLFLFIAMHISYDIRNIFISYPVGWTGAAVLCFLYYWFKIRKKLHHPDDGAATAGIQA